MGSVTRSIVLPGPISAAEELWYDLRRRPSFLVGFGHLVRSEGPWPARGSRIVWQGPPGGRVRVVEHVDAQEARTGQRVAYEDERLRGTQEIRFEPAAGGQVRVTVALRWALKEGNALHDWVVVRRRIEAELRTTLSKYRIERLADLDDERALGSTGS